MNKVCGLVVGAGTSAQYIGLGFVPDEVVLRTIDQSAMYELWWNRKMKRAATHPEGINVQGASDTDFDRTVLTDGLGIELYYGGDVVSSASANQVVAVTHPALAATYGADQRDATAGTRVRLWTKDTTVQGHFNTGVNTTYVGVGSRVLLRNPVGGTNEKWQEFGLVALTNDGDATNEADFDNEPPWATAEVGFISYKYDFANLPVGYTMPEGIKINETSRFNSSGNKFLIEAIKW